MAWSRPTDGTLRNGGVIDRASLAQLPIFETLAGVGLVSFGGSSESLPSRSAAPRRLVVSRQLGCTGCSKNPHLVFPLRLASREIHS
jgi:hypothetical protein